MFTLTATWNGSLTEEQTDTLSAQHRAQAILMEHPEATVKVEGPGYSATYSNPPVEQPAA